MDGDLEATLGQLVAEQGRERVVGELGLLQADDSGRRSSSHGRSRGSRCLTEFTFQVAIRIASHGTRPWTPLGGGRAGARGCRAAKAVAPLKFRRRRADVAQLVEHFTRNEGVPGSSPGVGFPAARAGPAVLGIQAGRSGGRAGGV